MIKILEKTGGTYSYHSLQIDLLPYFSEKDYRILQLMESISNDIIYTDPKDDSYGKENDPHITVLYGFGEDVTYFGIREFLENRGIIPIKFGNISSFRNDGKEPYDVLIIEMDSPELTKVHNTLKKKFKNKDSFPTYKPHMTLAYVLPGKGTEFEGECLLTNSEINIDKFTFVHKAGYKLEVPLI